MTDKTLRTLASGVTPQDNDLFLTRQGTDTADRKVTFAQIKATAIENLFNVTTDTLDDIDPGTTNKQFTATEKAKLDSIGTGANVISVNGETGTVVLDKADIGLGNVDNTSDANKPISTATQTALDLKYNASNPSSYVNAAGAAAAAPVQSVNGMTGAVTVASGLQAQASVTSGQKAVAVTGTAVALGAGALVNGVIVTASKNNVADIYVGPSGVNNTGGGAGNGLVLSAGQSTTVLATNLNLVYVNGTAADFVTFVGN